MHSVLVLGYQNCVRDESTLNFAWPPAFIPVTLRWLS
jgi:hypothetical protein